jgi:soluble lytic murein transglycosylase
MKKKIVIIFCILSFIPSICFAFTDQQNYLLSIAGKYGAMFGYPKTVKGVLMQETLAGKLGRIGDDGRSFGVMQVQLATAKFMIKKKLFNFYGTDKQLAQALRYDDDFNIMVGSRYIKYLIGYYHGDIKKAVLAYNVGPGNVNKHGLKFDPNHYRRRVFYYANKF